MAKKKKQATVSTRVPEMPQTVFKARFGGLIKVDSAKMPPTAKTVEIEGERYFEFVGLEGVYFSAKMFV